MRRATRAAPRSAGTAKPCQAIYGRCATSGQAERPTPPTPGGGGGHPGAVCRGEPQPQPSSSRRGFASTPPEHRRAGRRPPGRRAVAAPFWRGRAPRNSSGAAPMQGEPVTRGDCLTGVARAGRAPNAGKAARAGSTWATMRTLCPTEGVPRPCSHIARPIKAAHPLTWARHGEGWGAGAGNPLAGALGAHRAHGRGACGRDQAGGWACYRYSNGGNLMDDIQEVSFDPH